MKCNGRGWKSFQEVFGTEPLHAFLLPYACACLYTQASVNTMVNTMFCQCHQKLSTSEEEEEQDRKITTTSPFGPGIPFTEYQQQIYVLHVAGQIIQSWEECPVVYVGAESHL